MTQVRELGPDDAEAMLAIVVAGDLADLGESDTDLTEVTQRLAIPGSRWFGIDDAAGLAGFAFAVRYPSHLPVDADVRLRPGADPSLGPALLQVVRQTAPTVAPGRPVQMWVHGNDAVRTRWLTDAGAQPVRHFWRMVVDLPPEPPPEPRLPAGVTVVAAGDDDERRRAVYDVVDTSFTDHFGIEPSDETTYEGFIARHSARAGFDPTLWWLALVDDRPAAALIGSRTVPRMGFVNTLGTLREWRGRGLGRILLQTAIVEMHRRGDRRVALVVDASNPTGAVGLYESIGMRTAHTWVVYEMAPLAATR